MDKELIRQRFAKAAGTYCKKADAQRSIAEKMLSLTELHIPQEKHKRVLEIGCGTGMFTTMYLDRFSPEIMWINDICPEVESCFSEYLGHNFRFIPGDAENIDFPDRLNLIVSCSTIQWFEEPERFFKRCLPLLNENDYLAFSTFGKNNMRQVSEITGFSLEYRSIQELESSLVTDYEIIHSEEETTDMYFNSPMDVLKHLKETGVTGIKSRKWTKGMLSAFCSRYSENNTGTNGMVSLTYHPIYMILKKKKKRI